MTELLRVNHIYFSYHNYHNETKAVSDLSFSVNKGEFIAIVGPSGCGKSTLLSILFGLLKPDSGTINYTSSESKNSPCRVGYMLQKDYLFEWRTVYKNALLGLEINNNMNKYALLYIDYLFDKYNLTEFKDKHPSELSGGMKQRVALIRTLALKPDLLLMDEPFSALDFQTRITVSNDICNFIRQENKTMIIVTHDISEAISIADRVLILSKSPTTLLQDIPISLTKNDNSVLSARNAPEFNHYFNIIWEGLNHDAGTVRT